MRQEVSLLDQLRMQIERTQLECRKLAPSALKYCSDWSTGLFINYKIQLNLTLLRPTYFGGSKVRGGGAKHHPLEINKGAQWDLMLQKVILKPIKVMITCKKLAPYLKYSSRNWDLKNLRKWDFVSPWLMKIAITRSIFKIQVSFLCFGVATKHIGLEM